MDKNKLLEFKSVIKLEYEAKIKQLRIEMEAALSSLSTVENTLVDAKKSDDQVKMFDTESIKRVPRTNMSIPKRLKATLSKISGDFERDELFDKTNNDGMDNIPRGSLAPEFSKMIKSKDIIVVKEPRGPHKGLYRKAEKPVESSPAE